MSICDDLRAPFEPAFRRASDLAQKCARAAWWNAAIDAIEAELDAAREAYERGPKCGEQFIANAKRYRAALAAWEHMMEGGEFNG